MSTLLRPRSLLLTLGGVLLAAAGVAVTSDGANSDSAGTIITDVAYRRDVTGYAAERCRLDLYLPARESPVPIVVWFHGGGLHHGDKSEEHAVVVARRLVSEGIAVALVNYRLSPDVTYPEYLRDAAAAVAWVMRNCPRYGADADLVFVGGHSAGAYLTAMIGLAEPFLSSSGGSRMAIAGLLPVSGQMRTHSRVCAERGRDGEERPVDDAAPLHHVRADSPPWLLLCAEGEEIEAENEQLHEALLAAGHTDCTLVRVANRDHMGMVLGMAEPDDAVALRLVQFIRRIARQSDTS